MLTKHPHLRATTIVEKLRRAHGDVYDERILRALQRRASQWRAISGLERELIFRQEHPPG